MSGWIRVEQEEIARGRKVTITFSPEVGMADQVYYFETEEEADEAMDRVVLAAEELKKQGRADTIMVRGEVLGIETPAEDAR